MGAKVGLLPILISGALMGCAQTAVKSSDQTGRLDYLAKQSEVHRQKNDLAKIDREITRLRLKELREMDAPEKRALPRRVNEDSLYAEALKYYHKGDIRGLRFFQEELTRRYPHSVHADNILMLVGKLHRKQGRRSRALSYFQKIVHEYPLSNKRPSALLEKGIVYGELNLRAQAMTAFEQLEKEYPGSPESVQVRMEKKLLTLK